MVFMRISVHQEKTNDLPSGCELLAYTDACLHSFKVIEVPFWAFQFHPELDKSRLVERLGVYQEKYTDGSDHYSKIIESLRETPESNGLVGNFVKNVLLA